VVSHTFQQALIACFCEAHSFRVVVLHFMLLVSRTTETLFEAFRLDGLRTFKYTITRCKKVRSTLNDCGFYATMENPFVLQF
jgi:hypothetical protein